jgi:hypothetical protein
MAAANRKKSLAAAAKSAFQPINASAFVSCLKSLNPTPYNQPNRYPRILGINTVNNMFTFCVDYGVASIMWKTPVKARRCATTFKPAERILSIGS